jgi:hypothetical protein
MEKASVQKLIGKELPDIEFLPHQLRHEAENKDKAVIEEILKDENADVCNKQYLYGRSDAPAAELDTSSLVNHRYRSDLLIGPLHFARRAYCF